MRYIVVLDGGIEEYLDNIKEARKCVDDMVSIYCNETSFTEKELRRDVEIYRVTKVK